jgi:nitrogen fixation/metabolism regulation signal transduction histidine kinase
MKIFKPRPILGILLLLLCGTFHVAGQTVECPVDKVCITREAAIKAINDGDMVVAQKAELAVKDQAIADLKELLNKMRIEYAETKGELTAVKQNAVSDRAIIDILLKNVRPKKIGLINF